MLTITMQSEDPPYLESLRLLNESVMDLNTDISVHGDANWICSKIDDVVMKAQKVATDCEKPLPLSQSELAAPGRARTDADLSKLPLDQLVIKQQELRDFLALLDRGQRAPDMEAQLKIVNSLIDKQRAKPKSRAAKPKSRAAKPKSREAKSKSRADKPKSRADKPKSRAAKPKSRGVLSPAENGIKILCFDLDETILTSVDPQYNVGSKDGYVKIGKRQRTDIEGDIVDVVINEKIIELLEECCNLTRIKWAIVSAGSNTELFDMFKQYLIDNSFADEDPDYEIFGLRGESSEETAGNKRAAVQQIIMDEVSKNHRVEGVLFADDDVDNVKAVKKIGGITSVNVPYWGHQIGIDPFDRQPVSLTLLTDENIETCMEFIGQPYFDTTRNRAGSLSKKKKKVGGKWSKTKRLTTKRRRKSRRKSKRR